MALGHGAWPLRVPRRQRLSRVAGLGISFTLRKGDRTVEAEPGHGALDVRTCTAYTGAASPSSARNRARTRLLALRIAAGETPISAAISVGEWPSIVARQNACQVCGSNWPRTISKARSCKPCTSGAGSCVSSREISSACCAICSNAAVPPAPYTGPSLIGDSLTVGHYIDTGTGMSPLGTPRNITVTGGINDLTEFQGPPQLQVFTGGYRVDVGANTVSVGFPSATFFRPDFAPIELDPLTGEPIGPAGSFSFNGFKIANLNSSTGDAIQSVSVDTDMAGWDASRIGLDGDSVSFDWRGLRNATYFDATFNFTADAGPGAGNGGGTSVPEPSTLLLIASGIFGYALTRRRRVSPVQGDPSRAGAGRS